MKSASQKLQLVIVLCIAVFTSQVFAARLTPLLPQAPIRRAPVFQPQQLEEARYMEMYTSQIAEQATIYQNSGLETGFFHAITPLINTLSALGLIGKQGWIENNFLRPDDYLNHEASHRFMNPRYKEWWYFDIKTDEGYILSCSIIFSIVKDYVFLWVYDPETENISVEVDEDVDFEVSKYGQPGIELHSKQVSINGNHLEGYSIKFDGVSYSGDLLLSDPIPPRFERHMGRNNNFVALQHLTQIASSGTLTSKASGMEHPANGSSYYEHLWGVFNRYTFWNWFQMQFDNGWVVCLFDASYGRLDPESHQYAWLYRPDMGYLYFDDESISFTREEEKSWIATMSNETSSLAIDLTGLIERPQVKPVVLAGIPLGKVDYHQFPATGEGVFEENGKATPITSDYGMIEWNFDAIW